MVPGTNLFMKQNYRKILRALHRDLGYLFVGLICIYSISGIVLNLKKDGKDPAYNEIIIEDTLSKNLSPKDFEQVWKNLYSNQVSLNRIIQGEGQYKLLLDGGSGSYNMKNGVLKCTYYQEITSLKMINAIHYNSGKRFTWMANVFAGSMLFLALSGAVILKGKKGFKRRGIWLVSVGFLVPFLWYFLS